MQMGIACPRCGSLEIKATRKPFKMLTPRLSLRLWQCECGTKFMIANVLVKDETAEKLEDIYESASTEGIH
jgi:DNA-directed RNA polymerase subunit RPC12/RpoP